jgi:hypothetical protein
VALSIVLVLLASAGCCPHHRRSHDAHIFGRGDENCTALSSSISGRTAKVNGQEKPVRESLNGRQSNFYYQHIDRILDATYGKNPPTGTDTNGLHLDFAFSGSVFKKWFTDRCSRNHFFLSASE